MTDKHTPRRWERRGEYNLEIWEYQAPEPAVEDEEDAGDDGSGWLSVCTVHQPGEANARLIAAAPELLSALEGLTQIGIVDDGGSLDGAIIIGPQGWAQVPTAIKAAKETDGHA